ncbi:MAG: SMP-30/gluconolactonase/LRE family protein [Pseudomonadota bacterium]
MRIILSILALIFIAGFARLIYAVVGLSGVTTTLSNVGVEACEKLDIFPGTEDVDIDRERNIVYVSAGGPTREWYVDGSIDQPARGGIFAFELGAPETLRRVSPPLDDFLPHGISLWTGTDGEQRLFAINHRFNGDEVIEIFDILEDGQLALAESVTAPEIKSPNDLVAVGPSSFYVTNDRRFEHGPMALAEAYLALPLTNVIYYNNGSASIVANGLGYANGVNKSRDGSTIYVAEILGRRLSIFTRDSATGDLSARRRVKLPTSPDNIDVAADGVLWIAGHTKILDFQSYASGASSTAPSHVVTFDPASGAVTNPIISTGGEINAATVAAFHNGYAVLGGVFEDYVLICPVPSTAD